MNFSLRVLVLSAFAVVFSEAAEPGPREISDVMFLTPDRAEKLDLYLPAPPSAGKLSPAVVWIHGGGWTGGTKTEPRGKTICRTLASAGYVAVSIDYKLGPGSWPLNLLDCKNAVRFLRAHAAEYRLDPDRIAVAGGSAGGHLALMVGLTAQKKLHEPEAPYPGVSSTVRCVIDMYGPANLRTRPTDKTPMRTLMTGPSRAAFGAASDDASVWRVASPVFQVTEDSPPVLILHGRADSTVDYQQSDEMAAALKAGGGAHEYLLLDGVGHSFDWETWNKKPLPRDVKSAALTFLERHLAPRK